jgi:Restriction endonuclease/TIR domain
VNPEKMKSIAECPDILRSLNPREFEELVAELLMGFGWQIKLTPPTRDGGFDMLGISFDPSGLETSWIVECKHYAPEKKVGIAVLQRMHGVKESLGISNAALVTSSSFTEPSESFAKLRYDLKLVDYHTLQDWIHRYLAIVENESLPKPQAFQSCFISHSHKDHEFAKQLTLHLRDSNIRTWFAPDDLAAGKKLHEEIYAAISVFDKLIIILSQHSLESEWVHTEIRRARKRELTENRRILLPVSLVSMDEIQAWECFDADSGKDLAVEIREYFIPIFESWRNPESFSIQFEKVLQGLQK